MRASLRSERKPERKAVTAELQFDDQFSIEKRWNQIVSKSDITNIEETVELEHRQNTESAILDLGWVDAKRGGNRLPFPVCWSATGRR